MPDLGTRGILTKIVVASPVFRGPDRSGHEAPAAIRADELDRAEARVALHESRLQDVMRCQYRL